ncbi:A-kinase anchor protein 1, mitochondrial isoform X2 [Macrotis lagotis]|uniref:A-kinase anchor protein 1, mitochondrial isoform X2 n=1 Tax=Macrotis lagotis TaxID=92651 RepID=UPI003D69621A
MAIQFRAVFPLALPGVLALIGWWWFFSRKKEHVSIRDRQAGATAKDLRTDTPIEESLLREEVCYTRVVPLPSDGSRAPEKERSKSSAQLVTVPSQLHQVPRKSDSSSTFFGTTDTKLRLSPCEEDSGQLERAASQEERLSISKESSLPPLKDSLFPHEEIELHKQDSSFKQIPGKDCPGHLEIPSEQHDLLEKVKDTYGIEGIGDAAMGEGVTEEGSLSHDLGSESRNRVPRQDTVMEEEKEKGKENRCRGVRSVQNEECLGKVLHSLIESTQTELLLEEEALTHQVRGSRCEEGYLDGNQPSGELKKGSSLEIRDDFEQAAMQIISKVILAAKEEILGKTVGDLKQYNCQHSKSWVEGPVEEENFALVSQKPVLGQNTSDSSRAIIEAPMAAGEIVEREMPVSQVVDLAQKQKTYVSCLKNSLMSSAALDGKPKNTAQRISLAACPPQAIHHSESFEEANIRVEDTSCVTCTSEDSQRTQSVSSSGNCSDSTGTSGLEDSSLEPNLSPSNKPLTPPLLERTVSYSNGVLKGESSDLGTEDRWTTETEADQSGGSDVNSMDSVDSGCGLRKTESHSSSQAGTETNKVELTIWEIEVPKHLVGRLIGKQGRYVSFLKQTSGAKIYISTLPYTQNFQICHIEGSQHHVDKALSLIGKKFKELNLTNIYAPPLPSLTLPSLPMTSWLMIPDGVTVEVIVVNQVNAGHMFVQQHTHPTFHALRSLDQQMYLCYSQPGIPTLPTPVEAVICAAPGVDGAWWRAQVVAYYKESDEVEIRYVDYGGYKRVKTEILRQIRSDFVTLPFQGAEVLLDNVTPLSDEDHFSPEADAAVNEMTRGTPLLAQVTNYNSTGLPLIQLWSMIGDEAVSINQTLVERGLAQWIDSYYTSL